METSVRLTSFIKSLNSKLASLWNASEQGRALRKALNSSGESSVEKTIKIKGNYGKVTEIRLMMKYSTFDITNLKLEFPWRSPATNSFANKNTIFFHRIDSIKTCYHVLSG